MAAGVGEQVADDLGDQVGVDADRALGELADRRRVRSPSARPRRKGSVSISRSAGPAPSSSRARASRSSTSRSTRRISVIASASTRRTSSAPGVVLPGEDFELAADRGQRAAQLVRGVGDELALAGEGVVEAVEHVVEGLGEGAQLRRRAGLGSSRGVRSPASTSPAVAANRRSGAAVRAASR